MSDVNVSIGVSLRELQQGLNEAGTMVKGFKEQASRARESAMFLANGIAAIGGASKSAAGLAGNLLGGFAMGGPMGLAIGGVNALIQVFKDAKDAQTKLDDESKKYLETLRAQNVESIRARDNIKLMLALLNAQSEEQKARIQGDADLIPLQKELSDAQAAYAKARTTDASAVMAADSAVFLVEQKLTAQRILNSARVEAARKADEKKTQTAVEQTTKKEEAEEQKRAAVGQAALDNRARRFEAAQRKEAADLEKANNDKLAAIKNHGDLEVAQLDLIAAKKRQLATAGATIPNDLAEKIQAVTTRFKATMSGEDIANAFKNLSKPEGANTSELEAQKAEKLRIEVKYLNDLAALQEEATNRTKEATQLEIQDWANKLQPIASGFQSLFDSILQGGQNMGQALANILKNILSSYVGMLIQLGLQKVAAAIVAHMAEKPVKVAEATAQAGLVGAGTAAALASNPITAIGAIPAGIAAMEAAIASFVPVAAASGGFDIGNYNPITQLHAREMVLPATLADRVRNMTDAPNRSTNLQVTINAVDARSVERLFNDNQGALVDSIRSAVRNGRL